MTGHEALEVAMYGAGNDPIDALERVLAAVRQWPASQTQEDFQRLWPAPAIAAAIEVLRRARDLGKAVDEYDATKVEPLWYKLQEIALDVKRKALTFAAAMRGCE